MAKLTALAKAVADLTVQIAELEKTRSFLLGYGKEKPPPKPKPRKSTPPTEA
jgi:hypothetical protein